MNEQKMSPDTMMSFAHFGGIMVDTKQMHAAQGRLMRHLNKLVSRPVNSPRL